MWMASWIRSTELQDPLPCRFAPVIYSANHGLDVRPPLMKPRLASVLVTLLLIAVFGLGVFLLIAADEMPAPGLILMAGSGGIILYRWFGRHGHSMTSSDDEGPFVASEQARESYDYDMERRRRGEFDAGSHASGPETLSKSGDLE